jgi:nicotinamide riboside kinase
MQPARFLYIIGAQCTGKTTLAKALLDALSQKKPSLSPRPITEVARKVLCEFGFTRDDITSDPSRALELQELILKAQFEEETKVTTNATVVCDRSGADPIVYAVKYGPPHAQEMLEKRPEWQVLRHRMRDSLVILCPPHREWLTDDGVRLMAGSWTEWADLHLVFLHVLKTNTISFHVIPEELMELQDRVGFVLDLWNELQRGEMAERTYTEGANAPLEGRSGEVQS